MRWLKLIFICSRRGHRPKKLEGKFYYTCMCCRFPLAEGFDGTWHFYAGKVD